MAEPVYALFVHGVGEQPASYADNAVERLRAALDERGYGPLIDRRVHWAPIADKPEHAFLARAKALGSRGNPTQRLVTGTLADALYYQGSPLLQAQIQALLDGALLEIRNQPFYAFGHSLGCLILTDWLRKRPGARVARLFTMASNIGLFNIGRPFAPVPQVAHSGKWTNLFAAPDMLGYPMRVDPTLGYVDDVEVSVGGVFRGWTGLAHTLYWDDRKLWSKTIPDLMN